MVCVSCNRKQQGKPIEEVIKHHSEKGDVVVVELVVGEDAGISVKETVDKIGSKRHGCDEVDVQHSAACKAGDKLFFSKLEVLCTGHGDVILAVS